MRDRTRQLVAALAVLALLGVMLAACQGQGAVPRSSYQVPIYTEQGGEKMVFESGAELEIQSGATLDLQSGATTDFSSGIDLDGSLGPT